MIKVQQEISVKAHHQVPITGCNSLQIEVYNVVRQLLPWLK
jgi:hypothetical protein